MSGSYSGDLRCRVVQAISEGLSTRGAARRFSIGVSTAGSWWRRYRDHGETTARKQGHPPGSQLDAHEAFIFGLIEETPDMTLQEIADRLAAEGRASVCQSTVWHFLDKRGLTYKKRRRTRRNRSAPTSPPSAAIGATGRLG